MSLFSQNNTLSWTHWVQIIFCCLFYILLLSVSNKLSVVCFRFFCCLFCICLLSAFHSLLSVFLFSVVSFLSLSINKMFQLSHDSQILTVSWAAQDVCWCLNCALWIVWLSEALTDSCQTLPPALLVVFADFLDSLLPTPPLTLLSILSSLNFAVYYLNLYPISPKIARLWMLCHFTVFILLSSLDNIYRRIFYCQFSTLCPSKVVDVWV